MRVARAPSYRTDAKARLSAGSFDSNQSGLSQGTYGCGRLRANPAGKEEQAEPGGLDRTFSGGSGQAAFVFPQAEIRTFTASHHPDETERSLRFWIASRLILPEVAT